MKIIVNGEELQSHSASDEDPRLKPWRVADNLIKEGKLEEAQAHLDANIDWQAPAIESTLVYRVLLCLPQERNGDD